MTDFDNQSLYRELYLYKVTLKTKKSNMSKGGCFTTDFNYYFGHYKIKFTQHTPVSKNAPLGFVYIYYCYYDGHTKLLGSWNQKRTNNQYIYDMYLAVKNKYSGKPYINPYQIAQQDRTL